jgi:hypothetical protein
MKSMPSASSRPMSATFDRSRGRLAYAGYRAELATIVLVLKKGQLTLNNLKKGVKPVSNSTVLYSTVSLTELCLL